MDVKKTLKHIQNVIEPWDGDQFIRYCYLNLDGDEGMVTNKDFDGYIKRIREQVYKNGYTEEDLQKCISDGKTIASGLDGLSMDFS